MTPTEDDGDARPPERERDVGQTARTGARWGVIAVVCASLTVLSLLYLLAGRNDAPKTATSAASTSSAGGAVTTAASALAPGTTAPAGPGDTGMGKAKAARDPAAAAAERAAAEAATAAADKATAEANAAAEKAAADQAAADHAAVTAAGTRQLAGTGSKVTDRFDLPPTSYKVAWHATGSGNLAVHIQGADGSDAGSFNVDPPDPPAGEVTFESPGGDFRLSVEAPDLSWTVTFTPA